MALEAELARLAEHPLVGVLRGGQVVDEESAVMNSSTMCILACIAAVLAVNGPGVGWGRVGEMG